MVDGSKNIVLSLDLDNYYNYEVPLQINVESLNYKVAGIIKTDGDVILVSNHDIYQFSSDNSREYIDYISTE